MSGLDGVPMIGQRGLDSLLLELQTVRNRVITAAEKRTADECIEAVRKAFGATS